MANPLLGALQALDDKRAALQEKRDGLIAKALTTPDEGLSALQAEVDAVDVALAALDKMVEASATKTPGTTGRIAVHDNREDKPWAHAGEFYAAVREAARRPDAVDPRLLNAAATGANQSVDSEGGFLVSSDMSTTILEKMFGDPGSIAASCERQPIGANANGFSAPALTEDSRVDGSRHGGILGYWEDEADTITATKPKWGEMNVKLRKVTAAAYVTDELLADSTALAGYFDRLVPKELRFKLDNAIFNGVGGGQPLGFLKSKSLISVAKESGQAARTIVAENVVNMYSRFDGDPSRAAWFVNRDTLPQLMTMTIGVGTSGLPVWLPAGSLAGVPYNTILGIPVRPVEYCKTLGSVGDIVLADMSKYLLIDKGGVQGASSIHVRFLNSEQVFRFVYRVNGQPFFNSATTPLNGTNTTSPFVALATRG